MRVASEQEESGHGHAQKVGKLKKIALEDIVIGVPVAHDLCDAVGESIVPAGTTFTTAIRDRIRARAGEHVHVEVEAPAEEESITISVDALVPDEALPADLFDIHNVLLLRSGSKITP